MNQRSTDQLDKVLALADSSHEGEAVGAVRMARQLLSRDGLSFGDLARAASNRSRFARPLSFFSSQQVNLEAQIAPFQQQIADLQADNQSQATQIEFWRRRAFELEQQLNLSQTEAQRWKEMARETLEKLWDMGQQADAPAFDSGDTDFEESAPPLQAVGKK